MRVGVDIQFGVNLLGGKVERRKGENGNGNAFESEPDMEGLQRREGRQDVEQLSPVESCRVGLESPPSPVSPFKSI